MTESRDPAKPRPRLRPLAWLALAAVAGGIAGLAGVYGMGGFRGNADVDAGCRPAVEAARRLAPLARGEVAAVSVATAPRRLPDLSFHDADGRTRTLAEWHGRVVLLNLWATWCVPCRKEMPALDGLEAKLGSGNFDVVAVNIDTRDPDKPRAWLGQNGITRLAYYADPTAKVFQDLKLGGWAIGMPTTLVVDPEGCELARLSGPAEWASDDATALITAALEPERH